MAVRSQRKDVALKPQWCEPSYATVAARRARAGPRWLSSPPARCLRRIRAASKRSTHECD